MTGQYNVHEEYNIIEILRVRGVREVGEFIGEGFETTRSLGVVGLAVVVLSDEEFFLAENRMLF